jgi:hypothetical protein
MFFQLFLNVFLFFPFAMDWRQGLKCEAPENLERVAVFVARLAAPTGKNQIQRSLRKGSELLGESLTGE